MKKLFCLFILVFTLCFVYEKHLALAEDAHSPSLCLTILPEPEKADRDGDPKLNVALRNALWSREHTVAQETSLTPVLRVRFLDGTEEEKALVREIAPEWSQYANIRFEFVENGDSDIRIGFDPDDGHWSYVGTQAGDHPKTMNLALRGERYRNAVILHEFGHALALMHEHQNPVAPIQWNEEAIIEEMKRKGWSEQKTRDNILTRLSKEQTHFSEFDPASIMLYPIPNRWTIGDFENRYNDSLSAMDKDFIGTLYPVVMPDQNLRIIIKDALDLAPNAPITQQVLQKLTAFTALESQIRDLAGLEHATQLERLWLSGNYIVNIRPLSDLRQLTQLGLDDNSIKDITPLAGFVNLEELRLAKNPIRNMYPLCQLLERNPELDVDIAPENCAGELAKIYWATFDAATNTEYLKRADPSGGNPQTLLTRQDFFIRNLVVDSMSGRIYWGATHTDPNNTFTMVRLESADLDGRNHSTILTEQNVSLYDLAVDGESGKVYWVSDDDTVTSRIQRVNPNGGNLQTLLTRQDFSIRNLVVDSMSGRIYWGATGTDPNNTFTMVRLESADLDGRNHSTILTEQNVSLCDLAVDRESGKVYWVAYDHVDGTMRLESADLDGRNHSTILTEQNVSLYDLAVDRESGKVYWVAYDDTVTSRIQRADPDGGNPQTLLTKQDSFMHNLIVDDVGGRIYWVAYNGATETVRLESADLDGRNPQTLASSAERISTLAVATSLTNTLPPLKNADVNQDGNINVDDLIAVVNALAKKAEAKPRADVNQDGNVTVDDLLLVIDNLNDGVNAAAPALGDIANTLPSARLESLLMGLRIESDGSLKYQRAIAFLEKLLTAARPEKTLLLANYPNPFNPETWIPYQLTKGGEVSITIYDIHGRVVRRLELGHRLVGVYQSKNRAVYWDGRNELGEPVASGVYFYTLTAGDFTATRKMLIRK